ncbi:MAG: hypothetical protein QOD07_1582 [Frankiaceae bacterium]|jgi:hypothetical protein|nr:hypothetical protein [Frankiaceae bacterium]
MTVPSSQHRLPKAIAAVAVLALAAVPVVAGASTTYPTAHAGQDYRSLHIKNGSCAGTLDPATQHPAGSDLPPGFRCKDSQKLTSYAPQPGDNDYDPSVENNPQELFGVKGSSTNLAWEVTTGRPDTVIAVLDSGIEYDDPLVANKIELNRGELPPPCPAGTAVADCNGTYGDAGATYDTNNDGVLSVSDYTGDPRITAAIPAAATRALNPEDLIRTFSDGVDHDGNGYKNDIAGWDFYQHDNNPADDVHYDHGTGEAKDSTAEATANSISQCPNCRVLPLRVGDSFIADVNHFAAAVVYATDNRVDVVQEALGTLNHTAFAQKAVDYAYRHGVLIVASEADEEAGHHNYPAALNHTMVVNSVTQYANQDVPGTGVNATLEAPKSYLAFNGCTNFGGYTWVSVESNSCSSDATGQASGMAGLLYSAAENAVENGVIKPDASGRPLSAEEAKQLYRVAAQDIDFSDPQLPVGPANNFATTLPDTVKYVTTGGWDQITGWGRINADNLVRMVAHGDIPAEADITSPSWWSPLGTTGTVPLVGRVAAPRASSYTYDVEVAPGVQPAPFPATDTWTTVANGSGTQPKSGVLATLDLAKIRSLIDAAVPAYTPANDPTSPDLPEKDAFRVRVVVHTAGKPDAIEQREYFDSADTTMLKGFPKPLGADATSVAFADIDGDGKAEMVFGDGNGNVHAMKADGREATGFPVQTEALSWLPSSGRNGFTTGAISANVHAPLLLGSPLVSDLNHDGYPEIAVTDIEGQLHLFDHTGREEPGFPVHTDPAYSHDPGCETAIGPTCDHYVVHHVRDYVNTVDKAFAAMPSAGDLDPSYPGLEIVAGAMDGHIYAWHADGTPVAGWPVLLRDPSKVASVDPVSHRITLKSGNDKGNSYYGRQVITTPTLADINGDGKLEVVVNVDEEYKETPNYSVRTPTVDLLGHSGAIGDGNTRTYALWADGTRHPGTEKVPGLGDNAYLAGWPASIGMVEAEVLPDVGAGSNGSPVVGHVIAGSSTPQIATASVGGPPYLLNPDGKSTYGTDPEGHSITMGTEEGHGAGTDLPAVASLGGGVLGKLGGANSPMSFAMGATGVKRLLDIILPDQQLGAEDYVGAWDGTTGTFEPGFPARMNDLQFFNTPAIADVDGSGLPSVLQGSAVYDLRGYKLGGVPATGFPKFTGGWITQTPSVGDVLGDGGLELAVPTREGNLFVWKTGGSVCGDLEWPKFQHDLRNTGDYDTDATPPGVLRDAALTGGTVRLTASGDNGYCSGTAAHYVLTVDGVQHVLATAPAAAGTAQALDVAALAAGADDVSLSVEDAAGNLSYPVVLRGGHKHGKGEDSQPGHGSDGDHGDAAGSDASAAGTPTPPSAPSSLSSRLASFAVDADLAVLAALALAFARVAGRVNR